MAQGKRLSRKAVKEAIRDSGGIVAIVARKAGYSWLATKNFILQDEELSQMMQDESETVNDYAELTVVQSIKQGDKDSAKWWLSRTRRAKFGDNVQVSSPEPLKIEVVYINGRKDADITD